MVRPSLGLLCSCIVAVQTLRCSHEKNVPFLSCEPTRATGENSLFTVCGYCIIIRKSHAIWRCSPRLCLTCWNWIKNGAVSVVKQTAKRAKYRPRGQIRSLNEGFRQEWITLMTRKNDGFWWYKSGDKTSGNNFHRLTGVRWANWIEGLGLFQAEFLDPVPQSAGG